MNGIEALNALDRGSLIRLAEMLESNLLTPPFSGVTLRNLVDEAHVGSVSDLLSGLSGERLSLNQIALVIRAFNTGRESNPTLSSVVDVVVSGPDVTATARDTGVVTRQLFSEAKEKVLVVGFAIHQGRDIFQTLASRLDADQSMEVTLCVDVHRAPGNTSLSSQIVRRFAANFVGNEWPGTRLPRLFYDPRSLQVGGISRSSLHAKCVVIDGTEALVTSANFTEAAQARNIELGLHIKSSIIAGQIEAHFRSLMAAGHLARIFLP